MSLCIVRVRIGFGSVLHRYLDDFQGRETYLYVGEKDVPRFVGCRKGIVSTVLATVAQLREEGKQDINPERANNRRRRKPDSLFHCTERSGYPWRRLAP